MKDFAVNETQEFEIKKLEISPKEGDPVDLTFIFSRLIIKESLFVGLLLGEVHVIDTQSLIEKLPIVGEEKINIIVDYPEKSIKKDNEQINIKGIVYRVDNRKRATNQKNLENYTIHFCHEIVLTDKSERVSKTYKEGKISEYVGSIAKDYLKLEDSIEIEETEGEFPVTIPNLNPISAIKFLINYSFNEEGKKTMYLFYQDREEFKFKSIEKLIEEKQGKTKIYLSKNPGYKFEEPAKVEVLEKIQGQIEDELKAEEIELVEVAGENGEPEFELITKPKQKTDFDISNQLKVIFQKYKPTAEVEKEDVISTEDWEFLESFDNFESSEVGYYGFTNYAHDILTKSFHRRDFSYFEDGFGEFPKLNQGDTKSKKFLLQQSPYNTKIYCKNTNSGEISSKYIGEKVDKALLVDRYDEIRDPLKNTKLTRIHKGISFKITLPGNKKLKIGHVVEIKFPSFNSNEKGEREYVDDKYYSGFYLILDITHTIKNLDTWVMELKVVSDSLKKTP